MGSFKRWNTKELGPQPKTRELRFVHNLGLARPGTKAEVAVAMFFRPLGATQNQVKAALGSYHRNKIKQVLEDPRIRIKTLGEVGHASRRKLEVRENR